MKSSLKLHACIIKGEYLQIGFDYTLCTAWILCVCVDKPTNPFIRYRKPFISRTTSSHISKIMQVLLLSFVYGMHDYWKLANHKFVSHLVKQKYILIDVNTYNHADNISDKKLLLCLLFACNSMLLLLKSCFDHKKVSKPIDYLQSHISWVTLTQFLKRKDKSFKKT